MCHRIVAEKVCEDCCCKMGEVVIAFDACSRKCTTPSYRLSSEPLEAVCAPCMAAWTPDCESSTPIGEEPDHGIFPSPFSHKKRRQDSHSSGSTSISISGSRSSFSSGSSTISIGSRSSIRSSISSNSSASSTGSGISCGIVVGAPGLSARGETTPCEDGPPPIG